MPLNVLRCATDSILWDKRKSVAAQVEHERAARGNSCMYNLAVPRHLVMRTVQDSD